MDYKIKTQTTGDNTKKHCIIITGADNRAWCLRRTLPLITPWFDSVIVTDTGSTDDTRAVCESNNAIYMQADGRDEIGMCHEGALNLIPTNEWVYLNDSDECPTYALLKSFDRLTAEGVALGVSKWDLPCIGHWFSPEGELIGDSAITLKNQFQSILDVSQVFKGTRFLQKKQDFTISNSGSHYAFVVPGCTQFMPLPWNHYKGVKSRAQSMFIHAQASPNHHSWNTPEALEWSRLKTRLGITLKELASFCGNKSAPSECMSLWESWKDSEDATANFIHRFVYEFNFDGSEPECKEQCCEYPPNR